MYLPAALLIIASAPADSGGETEIVKEEKIVIALSTEDGIEVYVDDELLDMESSHDEHDDWDIPISLLRFHTDISGTGLLKPLFYERRHSKPLIKVEMHSRAVSDHKVVSHRPITKSGQ